MTFETEDEAKAWTETDAAKEWDLGFGGHFDIWEQKEKTIKEIEEESGESIEDAIQDFIESCHRVGKDNLVDNIAYFMRENLLAKSEEDEVRMLFNQFDNPYSAIDSDSAISMLQDEVKELEVENRDLITLLKNILDNKDNALDDARNYLNQL